MDFSVFRVLALIHHEMYLSKATLQVATYVKNLNEKKHVLSNYRTLITGAQIEEITYSCFVASE